MISHARRLEIGFPQVAGFILILLVAVSLLATAVSLLSPSVSAQQPAPESISLAVSAERGDDPTTASVSWTRYDGADFDHYRVALCDMDSFVRDSAACVSTAFESPAYSDSGETGPIAATGLDPYTEYVVELRLWLVGASDPMKFYWGVLALERPARDPEPTPEPVARGAEGDDGEARRFRARADRLRWKARRTLSRPKRRPMLR